MLIYLSIATAVVVTVFAYFVLSRWWDGRHRTHFLLWGFGLVLYAIGSYTASLYAVFGWQAGWGEWNFRFWYLSGAVLVAAWMGQGTVFLLWRKIAKPTLVLLTAGSVFAAYWIFSASVDPRILIGGAPELTGIGVLPTNVRLVAPFFNVYGVVTLIGGALWSAFYYWRRRTYFNRMMGNILIAAGFMMPAIGGSLSRFGIQGLSLSLFVGAVVAFWGFIVIAGWRDQPREVEPTPGRTAAA